MALLRLDALLAGAVGVLVGLAAGRAIAPDRAAQPVAPEAVPWEGLRAELRAIRELLAARRTTPVALAPFPASEEATELVPPPEEPSESTRTAPSTVELVRALGSLERALRLVGEEQAAQPRAGLRTGAEERSRPPVLVALRSVRQRLDGADPQVVDDLFGLSPTQVYERLGTPERVGNSPGRVRWMYRDPDFPGHLVVTFMDGYVAWVHETSE